MHTSPIWGEQEQQGSLNLPSFNAYPQLSVTTAGEYLMMLPQLLESLLTEAEEGLDTEWLDKVSCIDCDSLQSRRAAMSLRYRGRVQKGCSGYPPMTQAREF